MSPCTVYVYWVPLDRPDPLLSVNVIGPVSCPAKPDPVMAIGVMPVSGAPDSPPSRVAVSGVLTPVTVGSPRV